MKKLVDIRYKLNRNLPLLAGICLCLYFSYHIVSGERSYSRLSSLSQNSQDVQETLSSLKAERDALEKKVAMLRPASLSVDMVEEQSRFMLGYKLNDELVLLRN